MTATITFYDGYWYCYANATAMLLGAHGEHISPRQIEVLSGVGLGAFIAEDGLPFFSGRAGAPDRGITQALATLGFAFTERVSEAPDPAPFDWLADALRTSPVVVGPLDMRFLAYNPGRPTWPGVDHYVLVNKVEGDSVLLYDPAGFAEVFLSKAALADAWRADAIAYKRGHFRAWSHPRRIATPSSAAITSAASHHFKALYAEASADAAAGHHLIDEHAIAWLADRTQPDELTPAQTGHLLNFAVPLGVKRALDFASFFETANPSLAQVKRQQAGLFGRCQTHLTQRDHPAAATVLRQLADLERQIRNLVIG
ncbi:hypothetical protein [Reyranella sp. CPCC 100927]|uniref:hypothetical protein n=1 Tax=Reyranella sp. CPCC 100927 TaxID=2599616 RepID=UPI0011B55F6E|nr:hypothetical protein [Reyranella sp. CPCC 100927]TWT02668.1 hypothetical protein FQU96_30680 [Reyranella sp. CPCC 100927]